VKRKLVAEMRAFVEEQLPSWAATLVRELSAGEGQR
jgi:hypothetical protein